MDARRAAQTKIGVHMSDLIRQFGSIDIYVFDQLLRGRILPSSPVLDAGCGEGRNLVYLLRAGYEVYGADAEPGAISRVQQMAADLAPHLPASNFRVELIEAMSFPDEFAGTVLSSAVLHFARDDGHFAAMLQGCWRTLRPGGLFFCRLASTIGIETQVQRLENGRYLLPDGSQRYLVTEARLMERTEVLGGQLIDPLKTTVVQNMRSMTTWILRKIA